MLYDKFPGCSVVLIWSMSAGSTVSELSKSPYANNDIDVFLNNDYT